MKQLLILSGKGGTGKTTVAAAFIKLARAMAFADCDVDAPNLHFSVDLPSEEHATPFYGMDIANIDRDKCQKCGTCAQKCRFGAILQQPDGSYTVNAPACEGCGVCEYVCPAQAVSMVPDVAGNLTLYKQPRAVFSTAALKIGKGNSGLLVSEVKKNMRKAAPLDAPLAIIDGSPGIGCPVIASLNGVDMVLIVAEASLSGISDMKRIIKTAGIFDVPVVVCVNKHDLSAEHTQAIEDFCRENKLAFIGKIPFDPAAVTAVNNGRSIIDIDCPSGNAVHAIFNTTMSLLSKQEKKL